MGEKDVPVGCTSSISRPWALGMISSEAVSPDIVSHSQVSHVFGQFSSVTHHVADNILLKTPASEGGSTQHAERFSQRRNYFFCFAKIDLQGIDSHQEE